MRAGLIFIGCVLISVSSGCRTLQHEESIHLNRDGSILSCHEQAFAEALAHYGQGLLYNATDGTNSARTLSEFHQALNSTPNDYDLQSRIAVIAIKRREPEAAIEVLSESYKRKPKSYKRCLNLAAVYQATGHNDQAIDQYKKCLKLNNSEAAVYAALTKLYFESNQNKKAYKTLKRGINKADDTELIRYYAYEQAKLFLSKNDFKRAITSFKLLAKWDKSKRPQLYQLLAELFIAQNNETEAIDILLKATQQTEPLPANYITLATIQLQHDTKKGLQTLLNAQNKFPNNRDILFALGCLYSDLDQYSNAIPFFESARSNAIHSWNMDALTPSPEEIVALPDFTETFYLYHGAAYEQIGDIEKAEAIFEECIHKYPNSHHILNYQAYMWAEAGINLDQAFKYISRALEIMPNNPAYIDTLGWIYFKQNKFEAALKQIKKAHKIIGDDSEIMHHLGDIHHAMNNEKQAIACWKKSFSLDPENKTIAHKLLGLGINLY